MPRAIPICLPHAFGVARRPLARPPSTMPWAREQNRMQATQARVARRLPTMAAEPTTAWQTPGQPVRAPAAPGSPRSLSGLMPFLRPYRVRIALALLFLVGAAASTLVLPLALRSLIDQGLI